VAKTKELKKCYGAEEGEESSRQFWKEPSRASGSSFQRGERLSGKWQCQSGTSRMKGTGAVLV